MAARVEKEVSKKGWGCQKNRVLSVGACTGFFSRKVVCVNSPWDWKWGGI